jgi:hypothetical protein
MVLNQQLPQRWQSKRCWAVCRSSLAYAFVDGGIVVWTHDRS